MQEREEIVRGREKALDEPVTTAHQRPGACPVSSHTHSFISPAGMMRVMVIQMTSARPRRRPPGRPTTPASCRTTGPQAGAARPRSPARRRVRVDRDRRPVRVRVDQKILRHRRDSTCHPTRRRRTCWAARAAKSTASATPPSADCASPEEKWPADPAAGVPSAAADSGSVARVGPSANPPVCAAANTAGGMA
jgi:hypothetical protein